MAEKLKGLLDTARAKLTGLLGDFPAGFNSGAAAGFPGWAGDMAYMADTARLALTGADQQAAPENYIGTTEYIAKQAGYPVPQTLSGQLGAAVGGLMSPGPGDLAKFAPVLSAIPFWHGSPYKFDAFDLAHMGKGEGAQVYGWGAYGADAKETAQQYASVLSDAKRPEYMRNVAGMKGEVSDLEALQSIISGHSPWPNNQHGKPVSREFIERNIVERQNSIKRLEESQNRLSGLNSLYKGEYRWPDPAKEASTPLTGEDLLQWDRPLSEQPESVRRYFEPLVAPEREALAVPAGPEWGDLAVMPPYDPTGRELVVNILSRRVNPEHGKLTVDAVLSGGTGGKVASEELKRAGIPGIRYLDGMSRDGGQGTYNYVMFDDKGIKLLERNGAKLGREPITAYHKTDAEFTEFDPAFFGKNDNGYAGRGVYLTPKPLPGFTYGKDTLKVSAALENPYIRTKDSWNTDPLDPYSWIPNRTQELGGKPEHRTQASEEWTQMMRGKGHDGFIDEATDGGEIVVFDPKQAKILERNGTPIEDFAARRAGKAKPYKEAMGDEQARTLQDIVGQYEAQGLKLDAFQNSSNPDVVTLSRIQVPEAQRGQGIGSQAMADLVRYADEQGKTIALSPSTDFGASSVARLRDFYKRFGFVDNAGRSKDYELSESMYRRPGAQ